MRYTTKNIDPPDQVKPNRYKTKQEKSIQEKTGATAQQIRQAVEVVGFDRVKVEEYIRTLQDHS